MSSLSEFFLGQSGRARLQLSQVSNFSGHGRADRWQASVRAHMVAHCAHGWHFSGRGAVGPPLSAGESRGRMILAAPSMGRAQRVGYSALGVASASARPHSAPGGLVHLELCASCSGDSRQSFRVQQATGWGCALRLHGESPGSIVGRLCAADFACQCLSWPVPSFCDFLLLLLLGAAALLLGAAASAWIIAALARARASVASVASTRALPRAAPHPLFCTCIRAHAGKGGGGRVACGLGMRGRLGSWLGSAVGVFRMPWSGLECGCHMAARSEVTHCVSFLGV